MDVVHHMYDSSGNDSEEEELERERRRKMQELHEQLLYATLYYSSFNGLNC